MASLFVNSLFWFCLCIFFFFYYLCILFGFLSLYVCLRMCFASSCRNLIIRFPSRSLPLLPYICMSFLLFPKDTNPVFMFYFNPIATGRTFSRLSLSLSTFRYLAIYISFSLLLSLHIYLSLFLCFWVLVSLSKSLSFLFRLSSLYKHHRVMASSEDRCNGIIRREMHFHVWWTQNSLRWLAFFSCSLLMKSREIEGWKEREQRTM